MTDVWAGAGIALRERRQIDNGERPRGYWAKEIETAERNKIRGIQAVKLRKMVEYTLTRSRFYRKKLEQAKVSLSKIKTVEDVQRLPFTTRDEMVADRRIMADWEV